MSNDAGRQPQSSAANNVNDDGGSREKAKSTSASIPLKLPKQNLKGLGAKRLMLEALELREPSEEFCARPLDVDLFEWHFTLRGPPDTPYEGGFYHGRIIFPNDYPMKPPSIILLTPNGRFETNRKICLSISGYHPETWQPSWSIRTALIAFIAFMPSKSLGAIGSLEYSDEERRMLAIKSKSWKCDICGLAKDLLVESPSSSSSAANQSAAQESSTNTSSVSVKCNQPTSITKCQKDCNDVLKNSEINCKQTKNKHSSSNKNLSSLITQHTLQTKELKMKDVSTFNDTAEHRSSSYHSPSPPSQLFNNSNIDIKEYEDSDSNQADSLGKRQASRKKSNSTETSSNGSNNGSFAIKSNVSLSKSSSSKTSTVDRSINKTPSISLKSFASLRSSNPNVATKDDGSQQLQKRRRLTMTVLGVLLCLLLLRRLLVTLIL